MHYQFICSRHVSVGDLPGVPGGVVGGVEATFSNLILPPTALQYSAYTAVPNLTIKDEGIHVPMMCVHVPHILKHIIPHLYLSQRYIISL